MEDREPELFANLTGESWDRLFSGLEHVSTSLPRAGRIPPRTLCDVKRIPAEDMSLFESRPETDPFKVAVCEICGLLVRKIALRTHIEKRHSEASIDALRAKTSKLTLTPTKKIKPCVSTVMDPSADEDPSVSDSFHVVCSLCSITVPSTAFRRHTLKTHGEDSSAKPLIPSVALKMKTAKKFTSPKKSTSKSASASPPDLTDELSKESLKKGKIKKCKSPVPPELEPILPASASTKRITVSAGPPELHPADVPKKSSKKKSEKRVEKVFDPDRNCGVVNESGNPCLRSIFCKVHLVAHKRAVPGRSMPYDTLAKIIKSQNDEEKRPKLEPVVPAVIEVPQVLEAPNEVWQEIPIIKEEEEEPALKRVKTEDMELDLADLPSDLDALIEATLKDVVDNEPLPILPVVPRPEPVLRWSLEVPVSPPTPPPPPPVIPDLPWNATHPRPLAVNTFGCRLIGGLMTKSRKLDEFRKHVQSVWGTPTTPLEVKTSFAPKSGALSPVKRPLVAQPRRKRKSSGSSNGGASPAVLTGLLQRAAAANANPPSAPPNGVNGVPLRLFNNNNSQPTYIQLNLCPSK